MVLGGASLILLLGSALLMFPGAKLNQVVAAATDAPTGTVPGVAVGSEAPTAVDPSAGSGSTDVPPTSTEPPTVGGPTPLPPGPGATPRPRQPNATPKPTQPGAPTPPATPTPPTPIPPTPTPESLCSVPTLVGLNKGDVATAWSAAGFTGAISYVPKGTDWVVGWQSLAIGSTQDCTTGIQVRRTGP